MTEYRESKEDKADAATLARLNLEASTVAQVRATLRNPEGELFLGHSVRAIDAECERQLDRIEQSRQAIVQRGEQRLAAFYADREKLKRAMRTLSREGIVTSLNEARDSLREGGKVDEAEKQDTPRVWTYRTSYASAFEDRRFGWGDIRLGDSFAVDSYAGEYDVRYVDDEAGGYDTVNVAGPFGEDAQRKVLYLNHGPDAANAERIVEALRAEGLGAHWPGAMHRCIEVSTPATIDRVVAREQREDAENE